jgi:hypothetical protein
MAKDKDAGGAEGQRARLARGDQLEGGWCFDGDRDPAIFRCGEMEESVARGDVSVSYDGMTVTDLKKGMVSEGEKIERTRPVTLMEMREASGGDLPADTAATTVTTDNAPAGDGGGDGGRKTARG